MMMGMTTSLQSNPNPRAHLLKLQQRLVVVVIIIIIIVVVVVVVVVEEFWVAVLLFEVSRIIANLLSPLVL